jgi:hypothetical protein
VNVLNKSLCFFSLFISMGAYGESIDQILVRLRALPAPERTVEFGKLTLEEKTELFFDSNNRRPPYSGLDRAIAEQGAGFVSQLRGALLNRGGTPEILDFLGIVNQMKRNTTLTSQDIDNLKLDDICQRASKSSYCPVLLSEVLRQ